MSLAALLGCMLLAAFAGADTAAEKTPIVSLELKGASVQDAVKALFAGSDLKYFLRTATSDQKLDLKLDKVPLGVALRTITQQAGLSYGIEDGIYVIAPPEKVVVTVEPKPEVPKIDTDTPTRVSMGHPKARTVAEPQTEQTDATANPDDQLSQQVEYYYPEYPIYPSYVRIGNLTLTGGRTPLVFGSAGMYGSYYQPPMDFPPWDYVPQNAYMLGRY